METYGTYGSPFAGELRAGEHILWEGRPGFSFWRSGGIGCLLPFGLAWLSFSLFWEAMALREGTGIMGLFGLPFVAVGLFFVFGLPYVSLRSNKSTAYAVTNQRILISQAWPRRCLTEVPLQDIRALSVAEWKNGAGSIALATAYPIPQAGWQVSGRNAQPGFGTTLWGIDRPGDVHRIIQDARDRANQAGG